MPDDPTAIAAAAPGPDPGPDPDPDRGPGATPRLPASCSADQAPLTPAAAALNGWLLGAARCLDGPAVLEEFSRRLAAAGVPVWRSTLHLPRLHPQSLGLSYIWTLDGGCAETRDFSHEVRESDTYLESPVAVVHQTGDCVRCRLTGPEADLGYPIARELAEAGATDYILMPMMFGAQSRALYGMASKSPDGFTGAQVALVRSVLPALSATVEILMARQMTADLLTTYVGREASRRILDGQVLLGKGMRLDAVILFCDMRDFSRHMETLERTELSQLMRDYFACVVESVEDAEGDVLKFMGDGLLAIFPVGDDDDRELACVRALMAAQKISARLDAMNAERGGAGRPTCEAGVALHVGDMFYGNIGARARLDFTVMGPAVNRASRIEGLCRDLGERILTSADFAALCPVRLVSVGRHRLKGIDGEQEIFMPLLDARAVGGDD